MPKVSLQLGVKNARSCEGCTKCCEGWLSGDIYGKEMYPGTPCQFVKINVGCSIYEKRPRDPCRNFQCLWKTSDSVPEEFSPDEQGVILANQVVDGISYLAAVYAGKDFNSKMFFWLISYAVRNELNLQWTVDGRPHHLGSIDFINVMKNIYPEAENIELPRRLP